MTRAPEVSQRTRLTMPLAFVGALILATYAFAVGYSRLIEADSEEAQRLEATSRIVQDHENRIRVLESVNMRVDQKLDQLIELERQKERQP